VDAFLFVYRISAKYMQLDFNCIIGGSNGGMFTASLTQAAG
jgi:hypothetical protein